MLCLFVRIQKDKDKDEDEGQIFGAKKKKKKRNAFMPPSYDAKYRVPLENPPE